MPPKILHWGWRRNSFIHYDQWEKRINSDLTNKSAPNLFSAWAALWSDSGAEPQCARGCWRRRSCEDVVVVTPRCALFLVNRFCDKGLNTRPFQATDKDIAFMYIRPIFKPKRPTFMPIKPIFRTEFAEKSNFFDPIFPFEPGEVFAWLWEKKHGVLLYIFLLPFQRNI